MFTPRQFVIALTNREQLKKDISSLIYDDKKDYFLHTDANSGCHFPASGFRSVEPFNTIEDARKVLKYCMKYGPVICEINCTPVEVY